MTFVGEIWRAIEDLRRTASLLRNGLVRYGSVKSVDASAGTLVVTFASGQDSYAMPWVQRSTEQRVPPVGDHVIVLDPSLGSGQAVALVGWSSQATPPAETDGSEVLYLGEQDTIIATTAHLTLAGDKADIAAASDFVALSTPTDDAVAALQQKLDAFIATFNAHIHVTTATVGTGPVGVIAPTTTTETPVGAQGSVAAADTRAS